MSKKELSANAMKRRWKTRTISFQTLITVIAIIFVLLAFIPIFLMLFLSLKSPSQFYSNLWAIPNPPQWSNYNAAYLQLFQNMVNSVVTVTVGTLLIVVLSAMSGYVFARLDFPLKTFLFMMMLALMMVPGVLTLTPSFMLIQRLGLKNTWWALWLPWASGGQIMGMYLCRTFISAQPAALFESARIDGAREFQAFYKIAVPLAKPILATLVGHEHDLTLRRLHLAAAGHRLQQQAGHLRGGADLLLLHGHHGLRRDDRRLRHGHGSAADYVHLQLQTVHRRHHLRRSQGLIAPKASRPGQSSRAALC